MRERYGDNDKSEQQKRNSETLSAAFAFYQKFLRFIGVILDRCSITHIEFSFVMAVNATVFLDDIPIDHKFIDRCIGEFLMLTP